MGKAEAFAAKVETILNVARFLSALGIESISVQRMGKDYYELTIREVPTGGEPVQWIIAQEGATDRLIDTKDSYFRAYDVMLDGVKVKVYEELERATPSGAKGNTTRSH